MRKIGQEINYEISDENKMLILIANALFKRNIIKSFRDFSKNILGKNSNYINVLFYNQKKKASISALMNLLSKIKQMGVFCELESYIHSHIIERISKQYCRKGVK